jgi:hypothetical protein
MVTEPAPGETWAPEGALVGALCAASGAATAATVIEIVAVALPLDAPVAVTVNVVAVNVEVGVPDKTPVDVLKLKPVGRATEPAIAYVTEPVKLVVLNAVVDEIAEFCVPETVCVPGVITAAAGSETVILTIDVAVTDPAVAVIVNAVVVNVVVGVPDITPVAESIESPLGRVPAIA